MLIRFRFEELFFSKTPCPFWAHAGLRVVHISQMMVHGMRICFRVLGNRQKIRGARSQFDLTLFQEAFAEYTQKHSQTF